MIGFLKASNSFRWVVALFVALVSTALWAQADTGRTSVDLSGAQNTPMGSNPSGSNNMRQWFDRISLSGFINAGFVKTGPDGAEQNGHFYAGERLFGANLFLDAKIDEGILAHNELYLYNQAVTVKELYVEFKDPFKTNDALSFKVGRFDLPYGDEYLFQYPIDNPMVLRSAEWPWGFSQGVLVFGKTDALGWLASITDGLAAPAFDHDDSTEKALNLKVTYDPLDWLHLAVSGMEDGHHAASNLDFDSVPITPVGSNVGVPSVLGTSPNATVDFQAWQADVRLKFGQTVQLRGDFGNVFINDTDAYARQLTYYYGEAKVNITPEIYVAGRYSAIGTFDSGKGYMFGGDYDNATAFGYDLKSFSRIGGAVGWWISNNTVWKAEVDNDMVSLIDPAVGVDPDPGSNRYTLATEVDVKF